MCRRNVFQHRKAIYDKSTGNVILSGEGLNAFLPRSETRKMCPSLPLLFNIVLEVIFSTEALENADIQKEENENHI